MQSSEHLLALFTFCFLQLFNGVRWIRQNLSAESFERAKRNTIQTTMLAILIAVTLMALSGYSPGWTGRFYSLLDPTYAKDHIPIIASVSEHQPTTWASFFFDLHVLVYLVPIGGCSLVSAFFFFLFVFSFSNAHRYFYCFWVFLSSRLPHCRPLRLLSNAMDRQSH